MEKNRGSSCIGAFRARHLPTHHPPCAPRETCTHARAQRGPLLTPRSPPCRRGWPAQVVVGELPPELDGAFMRIGPNPSLPAVGGYHWCAPAGPPHPACRAALRRAARHRCGAPAARAGPAARQRFAGSAPRVLQPRPAPAPVHPCMPSIHPMRAPHPPTHPSQGLTATAWCTRRASRAAPRPTPTAGSTPRGCAWSAHRATPAT